MYKTRVITDRHLHTWLPFSQAVVMMRLSDRPTISER
jgi:hypothetical protein